MHDQIAEQRQSAAAAIANAATLDALEGVRVATLGKKGSVSGLMKGLGGMSPDERTEFGPLLNALKNEVADAISARKLVLEAAELQERLASERVDVTLPVAECSYGCIDPISQVDGRNC